MLNHVSQATISAAPTTDHCVVMITLMPKTETFRQKYWKFNADNLKDEEHCNMVKKVLSSVKASDDFNSYGSKWGFFKYKVKQYSTDYGKRTSKKQKES